MILIVSRVVKSDIRSQKPSSFTTKLRIYIKVLSTTLSGPLTFAPKLKNNFFLQNDDPLPWLVVLVDGVERGVRLVRDKGGRADDHESAIVRKQGTLSTQGFKI